MKSFDEARKISGHQVWLDLSLQAGDLSALDRIVQPVQGVAAKLAEPKFVPWLWSHWPAQAPTVIGLEYIAHYTLCLHT